MIKCDSIDDHEVLEVVLVRVVVAMPGHNVKRRVILLFVPRNSVVYVGTESAVNDWHSPINFSFQLQPTCFVANSFP